MTLQEMKSKAEALSNDDLIEIMLPYMFLPHDEADLFFEYLHQAKCNQIIALYKIEGLFYVSAKGTKENDNKTTHEFTTKASDVLRSGGWKKYIESKAQKDNLRHRHIQL